MGRESAQVDDKNKMMDRSGHCFIFSITDFVMLHMLLKFISNFAEKYYRIESYKELNLVNLLWLGIFL